MSMLGLNHVECALGRRVFVAGILGAFIGLERKAADRPAGVSTMSLVSIGASVFTIVSAFGFHHSPAIWDSSRVSAKIPDGIGFLCAESCSRRRMEPLEVSQQLRVCGSVQLLEHRLDVVCIFPQYLQRC